MPTSMGAHAIFVCAYSANKILDLNIGNENLPLIKDYYGWEAMVLSGGQLMLENLPFRCRPDHVGGHCAYQYGCASQIWARFFWPIRYWF